MSRVLLILVIACLVLLARARMRPDAAAGAPAGGVDTSASVAAAPPPAALAPLPEPVIAPPSVPEADRTPIIAQRALLETRRRFQYSARATYLDSAFTTADSVLHRWPDGARIRVAFDRDGVAPERIAAVEAAMRTWESLGLGIRFVTAPDSASADLRIRWIEQFDTERPDSAPPVRAAPTGLAEMQSAGRGVIVSAVVTLARAQEARPLGPDELRSVAVHELGHVLGLPHSGDRRDVMYPAVRASALTARDRASATLLYALPPGPLRMP